MKNKFIHKEGYTTIAVVIIILTVINVPLFYFVQQTWITVSFFLLSVVLLLIVLNFFRNPKRHTVTNEKHIIAPADGTVVAIEEVTENEYFHDKRIQVSIFMSPLNVHVNRYPVSGKIKYSEYHPGLFLVAWHPKSSTENERTTVVIESPVFGNLLVKQIAGVLARRIVCYAQKNEAATQGAELGFIKFGSRVDTLLPLGTTIKVQLNQKVRGGETVLAEI